MRITEVLESRSKGEILTEAGNKNLHLEHLEDLILNDGYSGAETALKYVNSLRMMLNVGGEGQSKVTVKWDGAPAIFCGTDPVDGKFFVGTKAVFGKTENKAAKSSADVDKWYPGEGLNLKLKVALATLSKLNIQGVLQGDMMFTAQDVETATISGEDVYTFTPNTITYSVPVDSDIGKRIKSAKIGVIFHTTYSGETLADMKAEFGASVGNLTPSSDVWFDDAYYKDVGGKATLTSKENVVVKNALHQAHITLKKAQPETFNKFLEDPALATWLKPFINKRITAGQSVGEPIQFVKEFIVYFKEKMEGEITKLKTGAEGPAAQKRLEKILATEKLSACSLN